MFLLIILLLLLLFLLPEVEEVFHRVHGQASKRFYVRVSVVDGMDVLVERLDVDEPVGEVEMELPVERDPEESQDKA